MDKQQKDSTPTRKEPTPFQKFDDALKRALSVPKAEIDRREKAWAESDHKLGRPKKTKEGTSP